MKFKEIWRVAVFILIVILLATMLGELFRPMWYYRTFNSFYDQPKNTIETVFLGASIVSSGIIPTELYNDYGISSFNLATAKQPLLESYYWVEEAYRMHPETLKTVVLDASSLRAFDDSRLGLTIDKMRLSPVKVRAVLDYKENDLGDTFSALVPLVAHHDRWGDLEEDDFRKYKLDSNEGTFGYYYYDKTVAEGKELEEIPIRSLWLDVQAKPVKLHSRSLEYFNKMISFCKEKNIKLLLIKTPTRGWSSSLHNAVAQLAQQHSVDFLDYNFAPLCEEMEYIYLYDHQDGTHLNYYGAKKLTKHLGEFLVQKYGATNIKGKVGYEYMQEQADEFALRVTQQAKLHETTDVAQYIQKALEQDNTIFLSVRGEVAAGLSDEVRQHLRKIGLVKLADIQENDAYVGVIDANGTIHEKIQINGIEETKASSIHGTLADKTPYYVSGGKSASCKLDYIEQTKNKKGINIVVYSNELSAVVDVEVFNIAKASSRETYHLGHSEQYFSSPDKRYPEGSIAENIRLYQMNQEAVNLASKNK